MSPSLTYRDTRGWLANSSTWLLPSQIPHILLAKPASICTHPRWAIGRQPKGSLAILKDLQGEEFAWGTMKA